MQQQEIKKQEGGQREEEKGREGKMGGGGEPWQQSCVLCAPGAPNAKAGPWAQNKLVHYSKDFEGCC